MNKADLERALKKVGASTALKPVRVLDQEGNVYEITSAAYDSPNNTVFIHVSYVDDDESES